MEYSAVDLDALRRALEQARKRGEDAQQDIDNKLADGEAWTEVAEGCAYSEQIEALGLRPWEDPPMYGGLDGSQHRAAELLRKMLAAGLSRWEPDPVAALAEREKARPPFST
jgi:hypothetical protein